MYSSYVEMKNTFFIRGIKIEPARLMLQLLNYQQKTIHH